MVTRDYCTFIKVGEQAHMEKLLQEGEVFCKTLQYFNTDEYSSLRHDKYDGAAYIEQIKNIKLYTADGKTLLGEAQSGQLYFHNPEDKGNIYCLYGIETETLDLSSGLSSEITKDFNLDMNGLNFGDAAVIIFDPGEFILRVQKEVKARGFEFQHSPINYYDEKISQGELSPFTKSKKFELQKEIRFWIPNKLEEDLIFKIGDISDIAFLLPKRDIGKLGYSPL